MSDALSTRDAPSTGTLSTGFNHGVRRPRGLLRTEQSTLDLARAAADLLLVSGLLFVHTWIKTGEFDAPYRVLLVVALLLMGSVYSYAGVYQTRKGMLDQMLLMTRAWVFVMVGLIALGFVTKTSSVYSREVILTWSVTGWLAQLACYLTCMRLLAARLRDHVASMPALVVGSGRLAAHIMQALAAQPEMPDRVLGYVARNRAGEDGPVDAPYLGGMESLTDIVDAKGVRRVFVALPLEEAGRLRDIQMALIDRPVDVIWAPDIFAVSLLNHSVREFAGVPLISLTETPLRGAPAVIKALMDRTLAVTGIIVLSPLLLTVAALVKLTSPGPILFKQRRHGWDGEVFEVWKFRSMYLHDDANVKQARRDDDRITPIGRFIRRTSIDELPQLFNVLQGKMSLVGPRPHAVAHNEYFGDKIHAYFQRHRIKPGLTGLAQVNGCRGETDTLEKMQQRVEYDLSYINNWSVWLDIKIIARTLILVFRDPNAY